MIGKRSSAITIMVMAIHAMTLAVLPSTAADNAASAASSGKDVAVELQPLVAKLHKSKVPVYLPVWLPAAKKLTESGKVYPRALVESGNYSAALSARPGGGGAATCFYISGGLENCGKLGKKVELGGGRVGYIENGNLISVAWMQGKYCYRLGMASDESDLLRAAKSVKLVRF